ncbi:hypothetical protein [Providencia manganoxydans]|uniref:hypothetical protein n=1 Tax=Providencia manganoxydans TaxID=2923283 RepID=UPI0032DA55B2
MPQDNIYKIMQAIINKYRQEVLKILKTGDLTPYTYCKAQHKDYGTYDANYDARHHIARGLQFTPELDGQEGVEELIRNLLKEEIKDRETNSFQGIGSTVEILVQLLQAYGHDADQLLFEQVKEANFDCHCGFEAGQPKRERDVYKLRDIQECIEILNQLKEHEAMSALIDIWKEQQTQWNAQNLSTWRYMERDRGNTQGEIQALQMLTDLTIQNGSLWDKCSMLNALLEKLLEADCTDQAEKSMQQIIPLFECSIYEDQQWLQANLSKFILMNATKLVIQQHEKALKLNDNTQIENLDFKNKQLWKWINPYLKNVIKRDCPWNLYRIGAQAAQIMGDIKFSEQLIYILQQKEDSFNQYS